MSKIYLILMSVLMIVLAGCGQEYLTVSYLPPAPPQTSGPLVEVVVQDRRADKNILSPSLQAKDLFTGSGQTLDIEVTGPDGESTRVMEANLSRAVGEAVKSRLRSAGFSTVDRSGLGSPQGQAPSRLVIDIRQFYLDLFGRQITAQVAFNAASFKQGKEVFKEEISGQSQRVHLLGGKEEQKALSQALANAVNSISLDALR